MSPGANFSPWPRNKSISMDVYARKGNLSDTMNYYPVLDNVS